MAIPMLKIRRPLGRLIFNMGIATPGKTVFLIEAAPWYLFCYKKPKRVVQIKITAIKNRNDNHNYHGEIEPYHGISKSNR